MHTEFVLDALEQALYARRREGVESLAHHSDRAGQCVSIRYTERLAEAGIESSVGSKGDSYDNALAETINGLCKSEFIQRRAPWKSAEPVAPATLGWVAWINHHRLMEPLGYIPPAEAETNYYEQQSANVDAALTRPGDPPRNPGRFTDGHPGASALPRVPRRRADAVLATDLGHGHPGFAFLQDRHDLALAELALPPRVLVFLFEAAFSRFRCLRPREAYGWLDIFYKYNDLSTISNTITEVFQVIR
jgi:hypothetical protein